MQEQNLSTERHSKVPYVLAYVAIVISAIVLCGWVLNIELFKRIYPTFTAMNPVSAVCFILIAIAVLVRVHFFSARVKKISLVFASVVLLVGVLKLLQLAFHIPTGIDQLLFSDRLSLGLTKPNRMAPNTAFNFCMVSLSLLLSNSVGRRKFILSQVAGFVAAFIALFAIIGYFYSNGNWYGIAAYNPMALHSATCFLSLQIAIFYLTPERGIIQKISAKFSTLTILQKVNWALGIGALLLLAVSAISYVNIQQYSVNLDDLIGHTYKESQNRAQLLANITDAETGQRGYLLTGELSYLEPYQKAQAEYPSHLQALLSLADNQSEVDAVKTMSAIIKEKMAELTETINLKNTQGADAALAVVRAGQGKELMDQLRHEIALRENASAKEIETQNHTLNQSSHTTVVTIILGAVVDLLVVLLAAYFVNRDLEYRKKIENELVQANLKDEAILNGIGDAVFAINATGIIMLFNPIAVHISGFTLEEAMGKHYTSVLNFRYENDQKLNDDFIQNALKGKKTSMANHTIMVRKDGKIIPVADSAAPIFDAENNVSGVVVVFRDVTQDRAIDRAKTEFVSLASHQLRTPLTAINWYAEMLLAGDAGKLKPDQQKFVEEMYNGNQRMVELVNSLLNVSRIDLGTFAVDPVLTKVPEIVDSVLGELAPQIEKKRLQIIKKYDKTIPQVLADVKLLRIVIQNLLSNGVKYTCEQGKISVEIKKDKTTYTFKVSDNGYGIPKDQQSKIFTKLFRADNARQIENDGNGLGLYLVKSIVEEVNGKIWFDSVENKGSTFYVTLPLSGMKKKDGAKALDT